MQTTPTDPGDSAQTTPVPADAAPAAAPQAAFDESTDAARGPDRYHRQMLLEGVGSDGQARLGAGCVLIVGCGALGCALADTLARAGVGRLVLVDRDIVEWTNLQRQSLFDERDAAAGTPKATAARARLSAINSAVRVDAHVRDFTAANAELFLRARPGVILDGTDNFETRFLLNDLAVREGLPYVYGGVVGARGLAMTIRPGRTPCLRCVFEHPPPPGSAPTCETAGVLGPAVQMIAAAQAAEALKLLIGRGDLLAPGLLELDLWTNAIRRLSPAPGPHPDCPCCARRRFDYLDIDARGSALTLCGRGAVQITPARAANPGDHGVAAPIATSEALAARLRAHGRFRAHAGALHGTFTHERDDAGCGTLSLTVFDDGRAIVRGTSSPERAKAVYDRYLGV